MHKNGLKRAFWAQKNKKYFKIEQIKDKFIHIRTICAQFFYGYVNKMWITFLREISNEFRYVYVKWPAWPKEAFYALFPALWDILKEWG